MNRKHLIIVNVYVSIFRATKTFTLSNVIPQPFWIVATMYLLMTNYLQATQGDTHL